MRRGVGGGELGLPVIVAQICWLWQQLLSACRWGEKKLRQRFPNNHKVNFDSPLLEDGDEVLCAHSVRQVDVARHLLALVVEVADEDDGRELSGPDQLFSFSQGLHALPVIE